MINHDGNNKMIRVMYIMIVAFAFTSVFSLIAVKTDNQLIKLWKEILVILFYICSVFSLISKKIVGKTAFILAIFIPVYTTVVYFLTSLGDNTTLVFYQYKNDLIPFLFCLGAYCIIDVAQVGKVYEKVCKILVTLGIINIAFILIQSMFTAWFLVFLQIDDFNNQSGASGLRLDNTNGNIRAMGTMTSFIGSGTFMILCIFILLESKVFNKKTKTILLPIFLVGALITTYKTVMIALVIYIPLRLILFFVRGNTNRKAIIGVVTFLTFIVMAFCFNNTFLYDKLNGTSLKDAAYGSVYIRVIQHQDILKDVEKVSLFTGVGIGVNGTEGPKDVKSRYSSKALDSTYVNLLSNYGLIGVLTYLLIFTGIFLKSIFIGGLGDELTCFIVFYHIGVEFFANNMLMNFPVNLYFSLFILFTLFYKTQKESENRNF